MPLIDRQTSVDRLNFEGSLTPGEIDTLVADKNLKVLQTAKPADAGTWKLLNSLLFSARLDVELRVYGHYGSVCDLTFLAHLPNLRRFAADCLIEATGVEHIGSLTQLEHLSIGIYRLESFDFLLGLRPDRLTHLRLGATFSKKPRLRALSRFQGIEQLYLEGQCKDIEVIGTLVRLRDLTLRSISVPTLAFLKALPELWSLDIKLGGTTNLSELAYMSRVKYLELWQIKGLADLSPIAEMVGLQYLFLQALRKVERLPDLSRLTALRRIDLENMKGLTDLTTLVTAPALEELIYVSAQGRESKQFAELLAKGTLKRMLVGFGNDRKNSELDAMQQAAKVEKYSHRAFSYI